MKYFYIALLTNSLRPNVRLFLFVYAAILGFSENKHFILIS